MTDSGLSADLVRGPVAAEAIVTALEASIALTTDELTGHPDWSINISRFWMALADNGFEIRERTDA